MPGACAPSTSESTPRERSSLTSRVSGSTSAVGLVTWSMSASRVGVASARERELGDHDACFGALRDEIDRLAASGIGMRGDQQFIAGAEGQRTQHGVDAGCCVGHERELRWVSTHEGGEGLARGVDPAGEVGGQKVDGLALHFLTQRCLQLEYF